MDQFNVTQEIHLHAGQHVVLVFHGLGANLLEVSRLADSLHHAGLSVVAPELSGFCHGSACTSWQAWVELGRQHVRRLRSQYATVSLCGLSMGATLALAVAAEEEVDSLVLLAAALAYDGWAMPWYRFLLDLLPIVPFKAHYQYREREPYGLKSPEMRAMVKKALRSDHVSELGGETISLAHLTEGLRLIRHARRGVSGVTCPTLLMHAVEDDTVCIRNAEWVLQKLGAHRKELIYLGDCYHMITMDNERETVMHETERFIKTTVNELLDSPAFEMPGLMSRELRRSLRAASRAA
ncbi:MAG: Carboxylesterase [Herminiimonas sp.]|nr:Carboxylesterase [Herminiimonas sp.]